MHQSGNILFLILIAVALFAALSYAITGSSRSGGDSISKDKAKISAAEIVQYGTQLEQAVNRLKLINTCSDTQLSFERAPFDGSDTAYLNTNAPPNFKCHVFHPAGGGVAYKEYGGEGYLISNQTCVYAVGSMNDSNTLCTADAEALVMILKETRGLSEAECIEINKNFGITGTPLDYGCAWGTSPEFKGSYAPYYPINAARGKRSGCFVSQCRGGYGYYHVLMAR
jgi:hypothetical protein